MSYNSQLNCPEHVRDASQSPASAGAPQEGATLIMAMDDMGSVPGKCQPMRGQGS